MVNVPVPHAVPVMAYPPSEGKLCTAHQLTVQVHLCVKWCHSLYFYVLLSRKTEKSSKSKSWYKILNKQIRNKHTIKAALSN